MRKISPVLRLIDISWLSSRINDASFSIGRYSHVGTFYVGAFMRFSMCCTHFFVMTKQCVPVLSLHLLLFPWFWRGCIVHSHLCGLIRTDISRLSECLNCHNRLYCSAVVSRRCHLSGFYVLIKEVYDLFFESIILLKSDIIYKGCWMVDYGILE